MLLELQSTSELSSSNKVHGPVELFHGSSLIDPIIIVSLGNVYCRWLISLSEVALNIYICLFDDSINYIVSTTFKYCFIAIISHFLTTSRFHSSTNLTKGPLTYKTQSVLHTIYSTFQYQQQSVLRPATNPLTATNPSTTSQLTNTI